MVLANASLLIGISGRNVALLSGYGAFSISPVTGFRLVNFKVSDFKLFPKAADTVAAGTTATLFPTADLVTPLKNAVVNPAVARRHHHRGLQRPERRRPAPRDDHRPGCRDPAASPAAPPRRVSP